MKRWLLGYVPFVLCAMALAFFTGWLIQGPVAVLLAIGYGVLSGLLYILFTFRTLDRIIDEWMRR